ncbi:MAG: hypothetical protein ABI349_08095 [Casimicrobiaceae bacterium]
MTAWPEYLTAALQRNGLFLELLRQRGNEEIARVPVVRTGRADTAAARRFSAAAAVLQADALARDPTGMLPGRTD